MEDEQKTKKQKKVLLITLIVFVVLAVILTILNNNIKKDNKSLKGQDYIIEKETEYKEKGLLPKINLNGEEIQKINDEIITEYYSVVYKEYDSFNYEYSIYNNILSLHIIVTHVDDSEYGSMNNLTYNIDIETNEVLSNDQVIEKLGLSQKNLNKKIQDRLERYYNSDFLKQEMSYDEYKKELKYDKNKNSVFIRDNKLYYYMPINFTQDLLTYEGNIYEIELETLEK